MSIKKVGIGISILTFSLLAIMLSNEWNRAAWGARGYIQTGTKFGLNIGENKQKVIDYLTDKSLTDATTLWANYSDYNPQQCLGRIYKDEYEIQIWNDNSWRRGIICVAFLDEKLVSLNWEYGMFQP